MKFVTKAYNLHKFKNASATLRWGMSGEAADL